MRHQTGESFDSGGDFVNSEGTFHFVVDSITEEVMSKGAIDHSIAFEATLKVAAGTAPGEVGKLFIAKFWHPRPQDKNEGALARLKIDRFLLATSLVDPTATNKEIDIDMQLARGRQFVAELHRNNKNFLEIKFGNIYHVDDPEIKSIPKDEETLKHLPTSLRKISEQTGQQGAAPAAPVVPTDPGEL